MTNFLEPAETGTPLPAGEIVFRLLKASKDGMALETHFALSEEDKNASLPALSIWPLRLTTPEQARSFLSEDKQGSYRLYALLSVDQVRELTASDLTDPVLNVVWDRLYEAGTNLPDSRPGTQGHAGITGLVKPPGMEKVVYKKLRTRLADLANLNLKQLPPP